jgi:hypothetical protein
MLYQAQGRFADAEPLFKRALALREQSLPPSHPDIARSLNGLALYLDQGRLVRASDSSAKKESLRSVSFGRTV